MQRHIVCVRLDRHTVRATPQAKASAKLYFVRHAVLFDKTLERLDYVVRAFEMARAADTYAEYHKLFSPIKIKRRKNTVNIVTPPLLVVE